MAYATAPQTPHAVISSDSVPTATLDVMATSVATKAPPIVTMVTRPSITYAAVCAPSHERQVADQIEARGNAGNRRVIKGNKKGVAKDGRDNGSPPSPKSSGGVTSLPIRLIAFQTDPMPPTHSTDHDPTKNSLRVSFLIRHPHCLLQTHLTLLWEGGGEV